MKLQVNNHNYNHITTEIERIANIDYTENTGITLANTLRIDPKAARISYKVTFDSVCKDPKALEQLWEDITTPCIDGIKVTMPYNNSEITFYAKVEQVSQSYLATTNGKRIWDKITVTFESLTPFKEVY